MAHVLALDSFACARYPHDTLPTMANTAPKLATQGGPVYYRQHEVIQLVEVPAPPRQQKQQQQHPSTITSSSLPSSSVYSDSCSSEAESEESEPVCSSYCSSDEDVAAIQEAGSYACYDDTYTTRLGRVLAWRDGFAKAMGVAFGSGTSLLPCASRESTLVLTDIGRALFSSS